MREGLRLGHTDAYLNGWCVTVVHTPFDAEPISFVSDRVKISVEVFSGKPFLVLIVHQVVVILRVALVVSAVSLCLFLIKYSHSQPVAVKSKVKLKPCRQSYVLH